MIITRKPAKPSDEALSKAADQFISGAPDAGATATKEEQEPPKRVRKGSKVQISLTIAEPLLDRVDQLAAQLGQSRAAVINLAVMQMLQSGLRIEGE